MYKFLMLLLITIALFVCFIEAKDSGLVDLPSKFRISNNGAIHLWYNDECIWTF